MRQVALLIVVCLLCAPTSLASAASSAAPSNMTTTTELSAKGPAWLETGASASAVAASTGTHPRDLPYTGDNLFPEAIAAVLLVTAGAAIRFRPRSRSRLQ